MNIIMSSILIFLFLNIYQSSLFRFIVLYRIGEVYQLLYSFFPYLAIITDFGPTWPEVNILQEVIFMQEKDNYLKNAELSTEQNYNMIDGIPNNAPLPVPQARPEEKPLDRVKEPPARRRSREREDR